jgi:hypothetical protein
MYQRSASADDSSSLARFLGDPVAAYEALSFGESSCHLSHLLNGVENEFFT